MNEMRKLMEAVKNLNEEPQSPLEFFANEVSEYCGENISPQDLEVYSDGMSYAILCKATDEQFLYSDNTYGEGELEPAEFDSWPPKIHGHYGTALKKVTEQKLDEYFVRVGEDTVGSVFNTILGMLDNDVSEDLEFEPEYLMVNLGFIEAGEQALALSEQVDELKKDLLPIWNEKVTNEEALNELAYFPHLETTDAYDSEEDYLEYVIPSYKAAIEAFQTYGQDLVKEPEDDDFY